MQTTIDGIVCILPDWHNHLYVMIGGAAVMIGWYYLDSQCCTVRIPNHGCCLNSTFFLSQINPLLVRSLCNSTTIKLQIFID